MVSGTHDGVTMSTEMAAILDEFTYGNFGLFWAAVARDDRNEVVTAWGLTRKSAGRRLLYRLLGVERPAKPGQLRFW